MDTDNGISETDDELNEKSTKGNSPTEMIDTPLPAKIHELIEFVMTKMVITIFQNSLNVDKSQRCAPLSIQRMFPKLPGSRQPEDTYKNPCNSN